MLAHAAAQRVPHASPRLGSWFFCLEWAREVSRACASSKQTVASLTPSNLANSRDEGSERQSGSAEARQGGLGGGADGGAAGGLGGYARSGDSERHGTSGSGTRKRSVDLDTFPVRTGNEDYSSESGSDSEESVAAVLAGKSFKCDIHDLSTGLCEEFSSLTSAANHVGITSQNVGKALRRGSLVKSSYAITTRGGDISDKALASYDRLKQKRSRNTAV